MCDAIAHPVAKLRRTRIGNVTDSVLRPGDFRDLTAGEIRELMKPAAKAAKRTHLIPDRLIAPGRPTTASRT